MLNNLSRLHSGSIGPRREEVDGEASRGPLLPEIGNNRKVVV